MCEVTTSCQAGWIEMFHISNLTNAHAELANNSEYAYKVCCVSNQSGVNWINNTCEQKYWIMLHLSNETNAHVELNNYSQYSINLCLNVNSTAYVINWSYRDNCSGFGECIVSVSNDTNAHVADCGLETSYPTKLCADIVLDTTTPVVTLLTPINDTMFDSAEVEFNYTVDDDNYIANCSLVINGSIVNTTSNIERQVNQSFIHTLTYGSFNWTINCTDLNNNQGTSVKRKFTIKSIECEVTTSCQAGYYDLLHMNYTYDAHAELPNRTNFKYKVCCKANTGDDISANCSSEFGNYWVMLHLFQETNSHVELNNNSNYNISACINLNSTTYVLNCTYKSSCSDMEACVASVNQETNSHIADCDPVTGYGIKLCCAIEEDIVAPTVNLISPVNGSTWDGDTNSVVTFVYNVSDLNNIDNCSLYIDGLFDQIDTTPIKDKDQSFLKEFSQSGNHTWYITCVDSANNIRQTPSWQFNFSLTMVGEAPNITYVYPTPEDGERQIKNWIFVNVTINSTNNNISTCILEWNNGTTIVNETMNMIGAGTNVTCWLNKTTIDGLNYSYRVYANESTNTFGISPMRSNIENSLPTIPNLIFPIHDSTTTNRTPQFNWSASSDAEGDNLIYKLNISCFPSCSIDNRIINSSTNENWTTLTSRLLYFWDDQYYYNWTVRVWDGYEFSDWNATPFTLKLSSSVILTMINSSIDLGVLGKGETVNTTDPDLVPLTIENAGNCFVDVNISIYQNDWLWTTQQASSSYYQYKIDVLPGEEGSFNLSTSQTTWTNIPEANVTAIGFFNYTDESDVAEIDILVTVPPDESAGNKTSQLLFTGWYVREI